MQSSTNSGLAAHIRALIDGILAGGAEYVVDFALRGSPGTHAVDLFVESDGVLDAERLASLSQEISFVLDVEAVLPRGYSLRVSSPGLDRPLRLPRQYVKHLGRPLRVHYQTHSGKNTEVCGTLVGADGPAIRVEAGSTVTEINHGDILWAKVQLPW